ncbi:MULTISPECIES: hypothetical protein [unclassified Micromonospora]|uniref:hypothetical protein n=1 Tax=unclassified Micromonospora TaxID=2617518 RepID=UPI00331770A7
MRRSSPPIAFAAIVGPLDVRMSPNDEHVLNLIAAWPHIHDLDECIRAGDITLDGLCRRTRLAKPHVFMSVARLEEFGLIPAGAIR